MELLFIGSGSGKSSLDRLHSSLLFNIHNKKILIDAGDGISKALLINNISFNSVTDIIFSHYHSDHLAGLPSLITQMIIGNRTQPLVIHTQKRLVKSLISFLNISYLFLDKLKFSVQINGFNFDEEIKILNDFKFVAKQNSHIVNKHNIVDDQIEFISSSFCFEAGNQNIIYTSDVGHINDLYLFQDIPHDIFITETTHIALTKIEDADTILAPNKIYLTHIEDEIKLNKWYEKISPQKKEKIIIAEDGMRVLV